MNPEQAGIGGSGLVQALGQGFNLLLALGLA